MNLAMLGRMMVATRKHDRQATTQLAIFLREIMETYGHQHVADLVRLVDVDQSSVSRYLSGQSEPTLTNLRRMANGLDMTIGELMVVAGLATDEELGRVVQSRKYAKVLQEIQDVEDTATDEEAQVLLLVVRDALNMFKRVWRPTPVPVDIVDRGRARRR